MLSADYKAYIIQELTSIYDGDEANAIAHSLFEYIEERKNPGNIQLEDAVKRLKDSEPLQYILGEAWFYNLLFKVNKHVLIPRPETEELVFAILQSLPSSAAVHILDMGTGSGCIPIALKKNRPKSTVYAIDISEDALQVAKENARLNKTEIDFVKADVLSDALPLPGQLFDIVVSNPPYIMEDEKADMHANVLGHEPHLALFVTNHNPLQFYEAIAAHAAILLKPNGSLYVEINARYGNEVKQCFEQRGFSNVDILQDMQGKNRMVKAIWR